MAGSRELEIGDEMTVVAVKTPMMPRPMTALMPSSLTLEQALFELKAIPPKDANARRVVRQLELETGGKSFDFLAFDEQGEMVKVGGRTTLGKISVLRDLRTESGRKKVRTAAFEVQAYAPVGGGCVGLALGAPSR